MDKPKLDQLPLFEALSNCQRILLAGAGGGYDVFAGLPLYFRLKSLGRQVYLANYSFTQLENTPSAENDLPLVEVGPNTDGPTYFPERYLAQWLTPPDGPEEIVYTFKRAGVQPLHKAYQRLVEQLNLDAVVLVDGGTDSLMRGDEDGLGTPGEDMTSIGAVHLLDVPVKLLSAIGFGVDTFHGVCHHFFLEAVADLTKSGDFLGAFSLLPDFEEAYLLKKAADYVFSRMPDHVSIVLTSILNATRGEFGDYHATQRTRGSELYINPLMSLYWNFKVDGIAKRCLYMDRLLKTESRYDVTSTILGFRGNIRSRPWKELPM